MDPWFDDSAPASRADLRKNLPTIHLGWALSSLRRPLAEQAKLLKPINPDAKGWCEEAMHVVRHE
jgi:hypothetical protein